MRLARKSNAFSRNYNKKYFFNYFKALVNIVMKKGLKNKAIKIISNFILRIKKEIYLKTNMKEDYLKFSKKRLFLNRNMKNDEKMESNNVKKKIRKLVRFKYLKNFQKYDTKNKKEMEEKRRRFLKNKSRYYRNVFSYVSRILNFYRPAVALLPRKVAGRVYQLPVKIHPHRAKVLIVRWFVKSAMERYENRVEDRLYNEFLDLKNGVGRTFKRFVEYHEKAKLGRIYWRFLGRKRKVSVTRKKKFGIRG